MKDLLCMNRSSSIVPVKIDMVVQKGNFCNDSANID